MRQLIHTILSIPIAKLRSFLLVKKNTNAKSLLESILYFKAINAGISAKEVIQFNDPVAAELRRFNTELVNEWKARQSEAEEKKEASASKPKEKNAAGESLSNFSEDHRMDFVVVLFQEYDREFIPNLKKLKEKILALIDLYAEEIGDGYMANALTSLYSAIAFTYDQKKMSYYFFRSKKVVMELFPETENILDVYASLRVTEEAKLINLLYKLDVECTSLRTKLEAHIESYILYIVSAMDNGMTTDEIFLLHDDLKSAILFCDSLTILETCLHDKGKDAAARLALFNTIFFEEAKKMLPIDNVAIDTALATFKQNILLQFSSNAMPSHALFSFPAFSLSSRQKPASVLVASAAKTLN
jgi:hypothetical protein